MNDNVVLDSGIIAAIFFHEKISGQAIDIAETHDCITVDFACAEVANVAWKRVNHSGLEQETVKTALSDCQSFIQETCQLIPARDLVMEGFDLACSHRITIYDALFLAAAVRCGSPLVTADTKLHSAANEIVHVEFVR